MLKLYYICPELGNLYGDRFNLTVLASALAEVGVETETVEWRRSDPEPDLSDAALVYFGPVTEHRLEIMLEAVRPFADKLRAEAEGGLPMLFTGAAAELAVEEIVKTDGTVIPALGIVKGRAVRRENRRVGDYLGDMDGRIVAGFVNCQSRVEEGELPAFETVFGIPEKTEGILKGNLLATYLTGPVLVRNPWLRRELAERILKRIDPNAEMPTWSEDSSDRGYEVTVNELKKRMQK